MYMGVPQIMEPLLLPWAQKIQEQYDGELGIDVVDGVMDFYIELEKLPGLKIVGKAKEKVSVISFVVDKVHPQDLGILLDNRGIAVRTGHHCAQPLMDCYRIPGTTRASFALYNTKEEVDRLVLGLQKAIKMLS